MTQEDIAKAVGVHRTTVSLALQNHPNISAATRSTIKTIADRMGYSPDPMLSALAAYRNQQRPHSFQGNLAWIANNIAPFDWRKVSVFKQSHDGATACAKTYGYMLETFDLQQEGMTPERLAGILRSRNITGILVGPQPRANMELPSFPWENFSAVTFGYTLVNPELHCITATQYRATLMTMRKMYELGYRNIGFGFTTKLDERIDHNALAAYLAETYLHGCKNLILPMRENGLCTSKDLVRWIEKAHPDALIVSADVLDMLIAEGIKMPDDIPVAAPMLAHRQGLFSGVCENSYLTGEVAVDYLVAMIQRGERGIPRVPQRILVEGEWVVGKTLPDCRNKIAAQSP